MITCITYKLRWSLLGACAASVVFVTTTALAGSGVGGVFNLGLVNTVDDQTSLTGNPGGAPMLKVVSMGTAAAVRGEAQNGIGTNGISISGVGQQGTSQSGIGTLGAHSNTTGANPGVQGVTQSTDPLGAGVLGRNNGGGPGLRAVVNAGAPPLSVNSNVKVASLNADLLDGVDGSNLWKLSGNAGTTPGTDFLGTTDNTALELKVNGQRALRLEPAFDFVLLSGFSPNVIGGSSNNAVSGSTGGATISGGSTNSVGGGFGTVGGGSGNIADGPFSTAAGGHLTSASAAFSAVGGGYFNTASGQASTVPGGYQNVAQGFHSFAAGTQAHADHEGTFVWADSTTANFSSTSTNQFLVRAGGGARFVTGGSTFASTGAALQAENSSGLGEAAWLRLGAVTTHPVLSLIKQASGTGNFLTCWNESGGSFSAKCHIDSAGTFVAGSDFAESLPARGGKAGYEPGDVLVASVSHPGEVERSHRRFDRALIGVYSTRPAVLGADRGGITRVGRNDVPVAITGIVPVKASAENGGIRPGDLLTSASLRGRAMRAGLRPAVGTVLGKSLGVLQQGRGVIKMLVMLR
jgi:hypothetical protein